MLREPGSGVGGPGGPAPALLGGPAWRPCLAAQLRVGVGHARPVPSGSGASAGGHGGCSPCPGAEARGADGGWPAGGALVWEPAFRSPPNSTSAPQTRFKILGSYQSAGIGTAGRWEGRSPALTSPSTLRGQSKRARPVRPGAPARVCPPREHLCAREPLAPPTVAQSGLQWPLVASLRHPLE